MVLHAVTELQFARRKDIIKKTGLPGSYVSSCLSLLKGKRLVNYVRMQNSNKIRIWTPITV